MFSRKINPFALVFLIFLLSFTTSQVLASSSYIDLKIDGTSRDIGSGTISLEGGFSVNNGTAHYWSIGAYYTADLTSGETTKIGSPENSMSNGYGDPFGLYDVNNNSFYAATYYDEGTSYIYKYDYSTGSWSKGTETVNIYGGAVYNGDLYISGLREPWSGGYDSSYISLFDSETGISDALIETGGASANVALDNQGNVYYVPYTTTGETALYRWTANQVASVVNDLEGGDTDTYLDLDDGEKLSDLVGGGNGITVDDAGNVFVTTNSGSTSYLTMWNGTAGEGDNYEILATNADGTYSWFGSMDIEGDFTKGDPLYISAFTYGGPITEITAAVPVPGALLLMCTGLLGLIGFRRKK